MESVLNQEVAQPEDTSGDAKSTINAVLMRPFATGRL